MAADDDNDNAQALTPQQAAVLLGVNWRTVRRWIDNGKLEGTRSPCTTTRAAVDAYKAQQQPKTGELLSAAGGDDRGRDNGLCDHCIIVNALSETIGRQDVTIERLARENGRLLAKVGHLEAELALLQRGGQATGGRGQSARGQRVAVWGRVGLWLKRSTEDDGDDQAASRARGGSGAGCGIR